MRIFLDTMIYLHFRFVDEIDFSAITQTTEEHEIVVPQVTIRELDKHKNTHPNSNIRERAKKVLSLIQASTGKDVVALKNRCVLTTYIRYPAIDFAEKGFDKDSKDDVLIATILDLQNRIPGQQTVLISDDFGPRTTASAHNIKALAPPEELRLAPQEDKVQIENRQLKKELEKLKNAQPKLHIKILLNDGAYNPLKLCLQNIPELDETRMENVIQTKLSNFKNIPLESSVTATNYSTFSFTGERERYNKEVDDYPNELRSFFRKSYSIHTQHVLATKITVCIENDGSKPADDVDIWLHFPDEGILLSELPEYPEEPNEPSPPRSIADVLNQGINHYKDFKPILANPTNIDTHNTTIRKTNSYEVNHHFLRVKHCHTETLDPFYLTFRSIGSAKSFPIKYRITAANLPSLIEGEFGVMIERIPYTPENED